MKIESIKRKKQTAFRLNEQLLDRLKSEAKKENRSLSNYVECLLYDSLERRPSAVTRRAMREAEEGKELGKIELHSIESFSKSLD